MKKLFICLLCIAILFGLCACAPTIVDGTGVQRRVLNGFVIIQDLGNCTYVAYNQATKVVYYLESDSYNGYLSPYIIYQDGYLYGAVFENGEITPIPYAYAPLE